tara:strand:- start:2827 stop:3036 length:210 start_codon:yes stop_codon:yes gene_type:complete
VVRDDDAAYLRQLRLCIQRCRKLFQPGYERRITPYDQRRFVLRAAYKFIHIPLRFGDIHTFEALANSGN